MTNLLKETVDELEHYNLNQKYIVFIWSAESGHSCTWEEFKLLADQEYDSGYGGQEVASDLIIAFLDGSIMWRHEYDGSECWEYKPKFRQPKKTHKIKSLFCNEYGNWQDLREINSKEES